MHVHDTSTHIKREERLLTLDIEHRHDISLTKEAAGGQSEAAHGVVELLGPPDDLSLDPSVVCHGGGIAARMIMRVFGSSMGYCFVCHVHETIYGFSDANTVWSRVEQRGILLLSELNRTATHTATHTVVA